MWWCATQVVWVLVQSGFLRPGASAWAAHLPRVSRPALREWTLTVLDDPRLRLTDDA
jgi:hypothetical protein